MQVRRVGVGDVEMVRALRPIGSCCRPVPSKADLTCVERSTAPAVRPVEVSPLEQQRCDCGSVRFEQRESRNLQSVRYT